MRRAARGSKREGRHRGVAVQDADCELRMVQQRVAWIRQEVGPKLGPAGQPVPLAMEVRKHSAPEALFRRGGCRPQRCVAGRGAISQQRHAHPLARLGRQLGQQRLHRARADATWQRASRHPACHRPSSLHRQRDLLQAQLQRQPPQIILLLVLRDTAHHDANQSMLLAQRARLISVPDVAFLSVDKYPSLLGVDPLLLGRRVHAHCRHARDRRRMCRRPPAPRGSPDVPRRDTPPTYRRLCPGCLSVRRARFGLLLADGRRKLA
mmetsp:Transcript_12670/g.32020  ORF Transcript_12670/g.32020 Transcript_12670/m.32020 type:complete len:265 (+) Transcript_12670:246-1040(+)